MTVGGSGTDKRRKYGSSPVLAQGLGRVSRSTQMALEAKVADEIGGLEWPPLLKKKGDITFQSMGNTKRALIGPSPSF